MTNFKALLVCAVLAMGCSTLLMACQESPQEVTEVKQDNVDRFNGVKGRIDIITDSETGCKYIYTTRGVGDNRTNTMTPLLDSHGFVEGCKDINK